MKVLSFEDLGPSKGIRYSRVHLGRLVKAAQFPAPVELGAGRVAWYEEEIDEWLKTRPRVGSSASRAA